MPERAILGINDVLQSLVRQHFRAMEAVPQMLGALTDLIAPPKTGEGKGDGLPGLPLHAIVPSETGDALLGARASRCWVELPRHALRAYA